MGNFSEIKTRNDFADFLRIPRNKLTHILYVKKPDSYYKTFEIPKKNGDKRKICAPSGDLKSLQVKLANALWEHQKSIAIQFALVGHMFRNCICIFFRKHKLIHEKVFSFANPDKLRTR